MEITVTVRLDGDGDAATVTVPLPARSSLRRPGATADGGPFGRLTPAEMRVLRLTAAGLEYKEAARILGLSEPTIRTHMRTITSKMDVINERMTACCLLPLALVAADYAWLAWWMWRTVP